MVQQQKGKYIHAIHHDDGDSRQWLRLFVVLTSVVITCACSGCSVVRPEMGFTDMAAPSAMASASMKTDTLGQCYHRCVADMRCMSLFYNRISRMCQLHAIVYLGPDKLLYAVGSEYYIISCDTCSREFGYMLNRKLGVCFALIPSSSPLFSSNVNSCQKAGGGRMMTVDTEQKHVLIREIVKNSFKVKRGVKLGLTRSTVNDIWKWDNGRALTWANWNKYNPTNRTGDLCAFMNTASDWGWNANSCTKLVNKVVACEL